MPRISSTVADFERNDAPGYENRYVHPATQRTGYMPMAFQVTSPVDQRKLLLPHALVMHVNPNNFAETHTKKIEKIQTRGGFVEQHWGDELSEISASGSTGSFLNVYVGLASVVRQRTIAWDRFRDLMDIYHNNGSVYDPYGNVVLQGQIMLMYDKGIYYGTFRNFDYEETGDSPYAFTLNWTFKVEHTVIEFPGALTGQPIWGPQARAPGFQATNTFENREAKLAAEVKAKAAKDSAALKEARKPVLASSVEGVLAGDPALIAADLSPEEARTVAAQAEATKIAQDKARSSRVVSAAQFANWQRTGQVAAPPIIPTSTNSNTGGKP